MKCHLFASLFLIQSPLMSADATRCANTRPPLSHIIKILDRLMHPLPSIMQIVYTYVSFRPEQE